MALDCELGLDSRDGRERKRGDSWETEQVNRIKVVCARRKGQIKPAGRAYPTVTEENKKTEEEDEEEDEDRGNQERGEELLQIAAH